MRIGLAVLFVLLGASHVQAEPISVRTAAQLAASAMAKLRSGAPKIAKAQGVTTACLVKQFSSIVIEGWLADRIYEDHRRGETEEQEDQRYANHIRRIVRGAIGNCGGSASKG